MLSPRTKRQLRKHIFPPRPPTRTRSKSAAVRRENNKNNSEGGKNSKYSPPQKAQPDPATAAAATPAAVDIDIRHIPHLISSACANPDPTPFLSHFAPDLVYVDHGAQLRILSPGSPLRRHHRDRWGSSEGRHRDDDDDDASGGGGAGGGDGRDSYGGVLVACEVDPDHEVWWRDVDLAAGYGRCRYRTLNRGRRIGGGDEVEGGGEQQQRREDGGQFSGVVDLVIERGKIARFEEWRRLPVEDGAGGGLTPSEYRVLT
ncbi:uncharacterized protein PgNI_04346 [Pyricularia grisea]|uniref:Uncharacterized protein n=1 Tax=Pyricularia grisea TaxID=148305 RepID=A0A6P8BCQ5_PYRGI|nr:uncharacterized protein PgNI_04346 [Pyricularia grisea]TLD13600.1 hypothetical protein PgNI_04346 [Pyricularia grisea]